MKKLIPLIIILPMLQSCSLLSNKPINEAWVKDTHAFDILTGQFANNIEMIWGMNEVLIAGPKDFVKYSDHYKTRSHINFEAGSIVIETVNNNTPIEALQHAIVNTLLMDDNASIDLESDIDQMRTGKEPFLFGLVLDNDQQPIRWDWRANIFAEQLLASQLKTRSSNGQQISYVTLRLVANHLNKAAQKYAPLVRKAAAKHHVDESLIFAIIQIESGFNPYAVSGSNAIGLMQVMQNTAGKDVFKRRGKWGAPSRNYLFNVENNISVGTEYLSILQDSYLAGIKDPVSHRYATITAYNGGAGGLLRVFHPDKKQAIKEINKLTAQQVYNTIMRKHPMEESRNYLKKVSNAQKLYKAVK